MEYNISYDIAAMILSVGLMIFYYSKRCIKTMQRRIFEILLWCSLISCALDIVTALINSDGYNPALMYTLNTLYLFLLNSLPWLYYAYFLLNVKSMRQWRMTEKIILFVPYLPAMLFLFINPWTGLVFTYTVNDGYVHAKCFVILFIQAFYYTLIPLIQSIVYRNRFSHSDKVALYSYSVGVIISLFIQLFNPKHLVMQFCVAISLLLLYLATVDLSNDEDSRYGVYNREAFFKKIIYLTEHSEKFGIIGINVKDYQMTRDIIGVFRIKQFYKNVIDTIQQIAKGTEFYIISDKQYVLIAPPDDRENDKVEYYLWKKFREPVVFDDNEIMFDISMFQIDCPSDAGTLEDIMDILERAGKENFDNDEGMVPHAGKSLLDKKRRENMVFKAMQKAIHNKSFKVYYQPIFDVKESYFHSAEALIRLIDEDLGFISPEEFIPLAEKKGLILDIGDFVFEQVCRDMSEYDFDGCKIKYIEINLSTVQCMQNNLKEHLFEIMKKYSIRPEQIDLEITETAMVSSGDMLLKNMNSITECGCTFAMDDFGTGFSNLSAMIQYPFNIIKLDKSMVWSAMEDERAMSILRHSVAMLKDLSMNIVAEGIETMEQANILSRMGCDYFQGYFYSKPVPVDEFIKKIEKMNF